MIVRELNNIKSDWFTSHWIESHKIILIHYNTELHEWYQITSNHIKLPIITLIYLASFGVLYYRVKQSQCYGGWNSRSCESAYLIWTSIWILPNVVTTPRHSLARIWVTWPIHPLVASPMLMHFPGWLGVQKRGKTKSVGKQGETGSHGRGCDGNV
jgi:hypothetical protein